MAHRPRKRFGQNFLNDQAIIQQILSLPNFDAADTVIEIGPGQGALTRYLQKFLHHLTAIEIDRDLCDALHQDLSPKGKLEIINADAMTLDYSRFGTSLRIIGNLPYNISTPLLLHLLDFVDSIRDMHFMLQKEVVDRIAASPGNKQYGRLSIMVQYFCQAEWLFDVPPDAFFPKPKVNSAVVRLTPYKEKKYAEINRPFFEALVAKAFSMRRKTLANNLKGLITAQQLESLALEPSWRPEQLSIEHYVRLSNFLDKKPR